MNVLFWMACGALLLGLLVLALGRWLGNFDDDDCHR